MITLKSRHDESEKEITKVRRSNINTAASTYVTLQKKTLGIDQAKSSSKEDGLEL